MVEAIKKLAKAPDVSVVSAVSPLEITEDGWLHGPGVTRLPSVRHSALTSREPDGDVGPLGVLWHWTGGVCKPGYAEILARKIQKLEKGDRPSSWHLVISKQGRVYQSVSLEQGSWHCKVGTIADAARRKHRVNRSLIGVELENAGRLKRLGDHWYCHPYWKQNAAGDYILVNGLKVLDPKLIIEPERATVVAGQGVFDAFTAAQVIAARRVLDVLIERYALDPNNCRFQHGDFDKHKEDAGPLWRRVVREWLPPAAEPGAAAAVS
jgi:N-acetyl-anhydromuramyl-L-alanine amidase AmpD